jgi:hypothetical protein
VNSAAKCMIISRPGPDLVKRFNSVINEFFYYARVFVPGKPFQISLMFASKAVAYSSGTPFKDSTLK